MSDAPRRLADLLKIQARWCEKLGSPLYAGLLSAAAQDCATGGPSFAVLEGHERDNRGSALALRFMGSVHRLALGGKAPKLARHYPSAGGHARGDAWPAFREALSAHRDELRTLIQKPVQTNEVGRSAALLGGFIAAAALFKLPLRLLEVGAAAGLNLLWDRYRYGSSFNGWGNERSPVRFPRPFVGETPPLGIRVQVASRRGCDEHPLDARSKEDRLTLMSYLWADQTDRFERLVAALEIARKRPPQVDKAHALDWLAKQLRPTKAGTATVVYHSIVLQYLSAEDRRRFKELIDEASQHATWEAPLAWLRFEPSRPSTGGGEFLVRLTTWPGRIGRAIASAHPHGIPVNWLGDIRRTPPRPMGSWRKRA